MELGLAGKKALVMGASTGIGKAIAKAFVAEGAKVAICARNKHKLDETKKEIGAALAMPCDLSLPGSGQKLVENVLRDFSTIDIVVTNTGGPPRGGFEEIDDRQWQEGFSSLWMSVVDSIRTALPVMKEKKWGRILLVTSVAGKEALPQLTISNGLRAGLMGLVRSISNEVANCGITLNSILPGYTDTERLRELKLTEDAIKTKVPAGRLGKPAELGHLAVFLASDKAAYITGQAIAVDGGFLNGF